MFKMDPHKQYNIFAKACRFNPWKVWQYHPRQSPWAKQHMRHSVWPVLMSRLYSWGF